MTILMGSFHKTEACPASELVLAFQEDEIDLATSAAIRRHLTSCEFCSSEARFYETYPPIEACVVAPGVIPEPLFELAEALLHRDRDLTPLYKLVRDGD